MAECQVRVAGSAAGEDTVLVAVHVRRTDFAEYSLKFNRGEHSGLLNKAERMGRCQYMVLISMITAHA